MKTYKPSKILESNNISEGIYELMLETEIAKTAVPGQFVMVYPHDKSTLLPRPISICEVKGKTIRLVYRVVGKGTKEFSEFKEGDRVNLLGPIGNGFPLEAAQGKKCVLMGGGIGIPPILELSKKLTKENITTVLGYRNDDLFLKTEFDRYAEVLVATEDGSVGVRGNVLDVMREKKLDCDVIYACGPMPMLRAIKKYSEEQGITAYISLEEKMACGVGACLGCVTKTVKEDGHSHVNNARVCTEGPVFDAREVDI